VEYASRIGRGVRSSYLMCRQQEVEPEERGSTREARGRAEERGLHDVVILNARRCEETRKICTVGLMGVALPPTLSFPKIEVDDVCWVHVDIKQNLRCSTTRGGALREDAPGRWMTAQCGALRRKIEPHRETPRAQRGQLHPPWSYQ